MQFNSQASFLKLEFNSVSECIMFGEIFYIFVRTRIYLMDS